MKYTRLLIAALLPLLLANCASSGGAVSYTSAPTAGATLNAADRVSVTVIPAPGMTAEEKSRLTSTISSVLDKKRAGLSGPGRPVSITVQMTRYDKGNAFARAMLAGLGQIHIDASVAATNNATRATVMSFPVKKTFAWGGMVGAATQISDVEVGFAEKIAGGLTGKN